MQQQVLFGGRSLPTRSKAEAFAEDLGCPTTIHYLDTVDVGSAAQKLRGLGVMIARKGGKNWKTGMVKFKHGKVD